MSEFSEKIWIKSIREFYQKYSQEPHSFEHGRNLLRACANWILEQVVKEEEKQKIVPLTSQLPGLIDIPNEEFISMMDFYDRYHMCHPNAISNTLVKDPEFMKWCGRKHNRRYEVQPRKCLNYLSKYGPIKLKKRAKDLLAKEEICQSLKTINLPLPVPTNSDKPTPI